MNLSDKNWRSDQFRRSITLKLENQVQQCGNLGSTSSTELENQIYMKAQTKEEYLGLVARLIIRYQSMLPNVISQGIPHQGIPPQALSQQGMPMQPMQQQVMGQLGMSQQGMQPQGMPPQGLPSGYPTATNLYQKKPRNNKDRNAEGTKPFEASAEQKLAWVAAERELLDLKKKQTEEMHELQQLHLIEQHEWKRQRHDLKLKILKAQAELHGVSDI